MMSINEGNSPLKLFLKALTISGYMLIVGCVNNDGSIKWVEGTLMLPNQHEIYRKQRILLDAKSPRDFPESMKGGVVFEGVVTSVEVKQDGLIISTFSINQVLYGKLENDRQIVIYSPSPDKGGVDFQVEKTYRVYTVYLKGEYRTLASAGTVIVSTTAAK